MIHEFHFKTKTGLELEIVIEMEGGKDLGTEAYIPGCEVDIWGDLNPNTQWDIRREIVQVWIHANTEKLRPLKSFFSDELSITSAGNSKDPIPEA